MRLRPPLFVVKGPPLHLRGGDREIYLFDGDPEPWLGDLLELLDGRELEAIVAALPQVPRVEIQKSLESLREAGLFEDKAGDLPKPRVSLAGESPLWGSLRRLVPMEESGPDELAVVHQETASPSFLSEFNTQRLRSKKPWLLVSLQSTNVRIGPLFVPAETCCWECYRSRLLSNRSNPEAFLAWEKMDSPLGHHSTPAQASAAVSLMACEIERYFFGSLKTQLAGRVLSLDLERLESELETVHKTPYCKACRA